MKNTWLNAFVLAIMAFVFVACNENESPTDPVATAPNAPTALAAQSVNGTTIGLRWTAPATGVTPTSYEVEYNAQGTTTKLTKTVSTGTSTTIDGLTAGTVYEFVVYAYNGTAKSVASSLVRWAPAARSTASLRLYGSNSSNGSGLGIFLNGTGRTGGPAILTTANGDEWDICFDDDVATSPRIGSPGQSSYVPDKTTGQFRNGKVARVIVIAQKQYTDITSLDEIFESEALTLPAQGGEAMLSIAANQAGTKNFAFVIGSDNGDGTVNYAKILVKRGSNGAFVQGTGNDTYVDVDVSYQTVKDVPYALRQMINNAIAIRGNGIPANQ